MSAALREEDGGERRAAERARRTSLAMIAACFRHQHPEAFGRDPVPGVVLPPPLRYGRDEIRPSPISDALPEERLARPDVIPLPDDTTPGFTAGRRPSGCTSRAARS